MGTDILRLGDKWIGFAISERVGASYDLRFADISCYDPLLGPI